MNRVVIHTEEQARDFLQKFNPSHFSLDTETDSLNWYHQNLLGISLSDGTNTCYVVGSVLATKVVQEVLNKNPSLLILHNAIFDLKVLFKYGVNVSCEVFDTMVSDHLIDENQEHGLKAIAKRLLDKDVVDYKEASKKGSNTQEFYEYAMNDAEWTFQIAQIHRKHLEDQGLTRLFREIEMPFLKVLVDMETMGVRVDMKKVKSITIELEQLLLTLEYKLNQAIGEPCLMQHTLDGQMKVVSNYNFNSSQQLGDILFNKLKLPVVTTTPNGKPSVNSLTLQKLSGQHPFVDTLKTYKVAQKLLSAFFNPMEELVDPDGRVRPHFHDTGTVTGRLSCSKPNLQQLPKVSKEVNVNTRSCFVASPGKKMIAVDYSQQELRIAAELCKDKTFVNIIKNDGDLHLSNANSVFGLGIPQEALFASHPEYEEYKKKFKKERDKGKVFSFGILYGMGPHKLSRDFNVSLEEAEQMLDAYFKGYPDLKKAIDETHKQAEKELFVVTRAGRRRHFFKNDRGQLEERAKRQSFNFLIQSYGADLIRLACVRLHAFGKKHPMLGIQLLMTVHDEIVLECNEEWAGYVATKAEEILEGCDPRMVVPLKAEASIGNDYGEAK